MTPVDRSERAPFSIWMQALVLLVVTDVALRVLKFPQVLRMHRRLGRGGARAPRFTPDAIAQAVEDASALVPWAQCVPRAFTCHALVRRAGHPCEVIFGVARSDVFGLKAHSWPECNGRVLLGPLAGDYTYTRFAPMDL